MTVAVVLATYNGEKFIFEQLCSILNQTRIPDKIIITDDGSTDKTLEICEELLKDYSGNYIITKSVNHGVIQNFFNGISLVDEDIIFLSDQDDIWNEEKIERMMECFECNPQCNEVLCNCYIWDEKEQYNRTLSQVHGEDFPQLNGMVFEKNSFWNICLEKNIATGMSMAFRKSSLKYCDYIPKYILHDAFINIVCAANGDVMYIDEPLALYRQHDNNTIGVNRKFNFNTIKNMKRNTNLVIRKDIERIKLISYLDDKFNILDKENRDKFNEISCFCNERASCMENNDIIKLISIFINNYYRYPSFAFIFRDFIVCFMKNKIID